MHMQGLVISVDALFPMYRTLSRPLKRPSLTWEASLDGLSDHPVDNLG